MSVGDTGPALHAYAPTTMGQGQLEGALSSVMESAGIAVGTWTRRGVESYCTGTLGAAELPVAFEMSPQWTQLGVFRLHGKEVVQLGTAGVFGLFFGLCEAAKVRVGRTDGGIGSQLVQESELKGAIRCLGWFNYYGVEVSALHREAITAATWAKSEWAASGAFGGTAWEEPMGSARHEYQVAAELGLPW